MQNDRNLIWLDMEMTGLNPKQDRIIEIAMIATDADLHILAESRALAIHQPQSILDNMNSWCKEHHGQSGLVQRVQESTITENQAEKDMLRFVKEFVFEKKSPLCGNSVYQDRRFLFEFMPTLESYFHYRLLDVSTLKILMQLWKPQLSDGFKKDSTHTALQDIRDSIEELRYYREHFLK